eukprot:10521995-Ditylum_brightwellii.AAC.3
MEAKVPIKALPCHIPDHARTEKTVLTANYFCDTLQQIEECEQYLYNAHKIIHIKATVNHGQKLLDAAADSTITFDNNAQDNMLSDASATIKC